MNARPAGLPQLNWGDIRQATCGKRDTLTRSSVLLMLTPWFYLVRRVTVLHASLPLTNGIFVP